MRKIEPTYLRHVYNGLSKGILNPDNASSLPRGFIGLFEDEFPANMSPSKRRVLLRRLTTWALFKSAVSINLVGRIFNEDVDDINALINKYSKWFNTPEPGKYLLYHDRLRTFLLQKIYGLLF